MKRALLLALLLVGAVQARAAVIISTVTGTVETHQAFLIGGSGYGSKSPAKPLLYADFRTSAVASSSGTQTFSALNNMAWSASGGYEGGCLLAQNDTGNWTAAVTYNYWTNEGQRVYIFRMMQRDFTVTNDGNQNYKAWRVWPSTVNYPNMYFAPSNGEANVEDAGGTGFYGDWRWPNTGYNAEEIIFKASSAINVKDGSLTELINNVEKGDGSLMTRFTSRPDYMSVNYVVHEVQANKGSWIPAWNSSWRVRADNIYVDITWSRVMLGNAATYAACTRLQPQIPSAWSATSITLTGNTAGFSGGSTGYLYVFDSAGNHNAAGFPVTIGGVIPLSSPPALTSIHPSSGPYQGGTRVVFTGTDFIEGASVQFGTMTAIVADFTSSTHLEAVSPAGPYGAAVNAKVINPDSQSSTITSTFTYANVSNPQPDITSVTPSTGSHAGGTRIVIRGTQFVTGCTVQFGTMTPVSGSFTSSTHVEAVAPAGPIATTVDVKLTNPLGEFDTQASTFTYSALDAPDLTSIHPSTGSYVGGTRVVLHGTSFVTGCTVKFGTMTAVSGSFTSATHVEAVTPAGPPTGVPVDVRLTNPDAQFDTIASTFTYSQPPPVVIGSGTLPWK